MSKNHFTPSMSMSTLKLPDISDLFSSASGPVAIRMTNDYLFHALFQTNNKALKGLISSLLHLHPDEILSAEITNPIILGAAIDEKDFILDINVLLNNSIILNLELQVLNQHNWPERSLSYLCRSFDSLNSGEDYQLVRPAIHIGLLDFTLFEDHPEFYATYMMLNVKNYMVYSDKLRLSVVDLTHIDLATEEDKRYHIDQWAALFKAATWEEIKMIAQQNDYLQEASKAYYRLTQEERIRQICEAREDYYRCQRGMQRIIDEQAAALAEKDAIIASLLAEKDAAMAEKDTILAEKDSLIASLLAEKELWRKG